MTRYPYERPLCEAERYLTKLTLLADSDLTDGGAGDILLPGDEYEL